MKGNLNPRQELQQISVREKVDVTCPIAGQDTLNEEELTELGAGFFGKTTIHADMNLGPHRRG